MGRRRRIFLGAQEIAGMMERLNNAFHEMGIESDFYCILEYGFSPDETEKNNNAIIKKCRIHTKKREAASKKYIKKWWSFLQMWDILHLFFHVLFRYDSFIYIFGHGMFYYNEYLIKIEELEFFVLKFFHKKIVMWLCGSDSRAPYCSGGIYYRRVERLYSETQKKVKRIKMLEKYMVLIDSPASSHFHTKPYLISQCVGIPVDCKEKVYNNKKLVNKVTILHAPSNQRGKGTKIIKGILEEVKKEGYDFEYIEVSGLPHNIVLEKMAMCDIVVDQLYSDTPMAGFATEAAINGVPVVVGGYYAELYKKVLPHPVAPTVYCKPNDIKEKIIYLIEHEEERKRIGNEEKAYIEDNCLSTIVANKFLKILDKSYPEEWLMNPSDNNYIWGAGVDKKLVVDEIVRLIDNYGPEALCLDENGILYKKYIGLYNEAKMAKNSKKEKQSF